MKSPPTPSQVPLETRLRVLGDNPQKIFMELLEEFLEQHKMRFPLIGSAVSLPLMKYTRMANFSYEEVLKVMEDRIPELKMQYFSQTDFFENEYRTFIETTRAAFAGAQSARENQPKSGISPTLNSTPASSTRGSVSVQDGTKDFGDRIETALKRLGS